MARFCFVHGAWHGGWAWELLRPELEGRGHKVVAPDLPCEDVDAGVVEYAAVVRAALEGADDGIVVGHSLGGLTIPLVPARKLVFLCALVPEPGKALVDRGPGTFVPGFADTTVRDGLGRSYWPDGAGAIRDLYNDVPAEVATAATARLRPQARQPSIEPSPLAKLPEIEYAYVATTGDRAIRPDHQLSLASEELGIEPIVLPGGHSPMLSRPRELADVLDSLA
jgi:pimeloyl-ACP methyl ester carboxylesterase